MPTEVASATVTPFRGMSRTIHATSAPVEIWGPPVLTLCGKNVIPWGTTWQPVAWQGMAASGHPDVCKGCASPKR